MSIAVKAGIAELIVIFYHIWEFGSRHSVT